MTQIKTTEIDGWTIGQIVHNGIVVWCTSAHRRPSQAAKEARDHLARMSRWDVSRSAEMAGGAT